jgi:hypothetical protein
MSARFFGGCAPLSILVCRRFRHTLALELLGAGAIFEELAGILGNSPETIRNITQKGCWRGITEFRLPTSDAVCMLLAPACRA